MCRRLFGVVLCLVLLHFSNASDFVIDDDPAICDAGTTMGTCMPLPDCPPALEALHRTRRHNFKRCGFQGSVEVICCPNQKETTIPTPITTTTSKAQMRGSQIGKSVEACEEYSSVYNLEVNFQILGGEDAEPGEFPHMAVLGYQKEDASALSWDCGGSLISDRYVVTAAHCIALRDGKLVKIRMGSNDISSTNATVLPVDYDIDKTTMHPKYSRRARSNDIALILLASKVNFTKYVRPACLYQKSDDPRSLIIIGFGSTSYGGEVSTILQKAFLDPVPVPRCNASHNSVPGGKNITVTQICATSSDGKRDTCQGDSGGPLQVQLRETSSIYHIVGVTSFGRACGGTYPGVYTRIYSYLSWIEGIVWPEETPA